MTTKNYESKGLTKKIKSHHITPYHRSWCRVHHEWPEKPKMTGNWVMIQPSRKLSHMEEPVFSVQWIPKMVHCCLSFFKNVKMWKRSVYMSLSFQLFHPTSGEVHVWWANNRMIPVIIVLMLGLWEFDLVALVIIWIPDLHYDICLLEAFSCWVNQYYFPLSSTWVTGLEASLSLILY